jgi:DNA-directed RNA polymerase subunit RPC12/RpoP
VFEQLTPKGETMSIWECMECGKRLTAKAATKAVNDTGCPNCGGFDIDLGDLRRDFENRTTTTLQAIAAKQRLDAHYHKDAFTGEYYPR